MDNIQRIRLAAEEAAKNVPVNPAYIATPIYYEAPVFLAVASLLESGKISIVEMPEFNPDQDNLIASTNTHLLDLLDLDIPKMAWEVWQIRETPELWDEMIHETLRKELGVA